MFVRRYAQPDDYFATTHRELCAAHGHHPALFCRCNPPTRTHVGSVAAPGQPSAAVLKSIASDDGGADDMLSLPSSYSPNDQRTTQIPLTNVVTESNFAAKVGGVVHNHLQLAALAQHALFLIHSLHGCIYLLVYCGVRD